MKNELAGPAWPSGAREHTAASAASADTAASATTGPAPLSTAVSPAAPSTERRGGRRYRTTHARGRRYRDGRPAAAISPRAQRRPGVEISSFPSLAATPKALARMFAVSLASCLLAAWLHIPLIAGLGFCAGCVLATRYSTRQAQLQVVLSIPVTFLAALLIAELVVPGGGSGHRTVLSVLAGTVLTLAGVAPLLFAGTAVGVGIALFRGLPQCIRDLRAERHGNRSPAARRG